jgi:hypothetical protein
MPVERGSPSTTFTKLARYLAGVAAWSQADHDAAIIYAARTAQRYGWAAGLGEEVMRLLRYGWKDDVKSY